MFTLMLDIFGGAVVGNGGAAALSSRYHSEVSLPNLDGRTVRYGFRHFCDAAESYLV